MLHDVILFDLDGTLSDPLEGIARSINFALVHFGYDPLESGEVAAFVGPPIDQTLSRITGLTSERKLSDLVAKYRERYAEFGYAENVLYPGVRDALATLSDAGILMAICTSKRKDFAEQILEMFKLRHHFSFVDGGEIGVEKWQQVGALRSQGKVSDASVLVGDRAVDLMAAHRNSLIAGGVLWGYGSYAELSKERPFYLFRSPAELSRLAG
jgi:phosphoglycolate phosphatase